MAYVWVILGLMALIVLHEAGHFLSAKAVGMRAYRFSLFFGPALVSRTVGDTEYRIGSIPLGGYVKIAGMNPEEVYEGELALEYPDARSDPRAYYNQPVWKRIVVIAAGPAVNLVVAILIFAGVLFFGGFSTVTNRVGQVSAGSAAVGRLHAGDVVVAIDGRRSLAGRLNAVAASHCAGGRPTDGCVASPAVTVEVRRAGRRLDISLHPRYSRAGGRNLIGIEYAAGPYRPGVLTALHEGLQQTWTEVSATFSNLARIYQARERRQLHSIAGATRLAEQATARSTAQGLWVMGGISLALAVVNLLPFLPLDGGHIFWALVEKVRRGRQVSLRTMERASFVGLALILALFAIGLSNDISTFAHGGNFLPPGR